MGLEGVYVMPSRKKVNHDKLHMPEWAPSGTCYCMKACCWVEHNNDPLKGGICICKECPCGGSEIRFVRMPS